MMPITQQTIAFIGAGSLNQLIAKEIAGGNYRLLLFDSDFQKFDDLAKEIHELHPKAEVNLMDCAHECSWEADIIILNIPKGGKKKIAQKIRNVAAQKIVVYVTNYDSSVTEVLRSKLPYSKIVQIIPRTKNGSHHTDIFINGTDEQALQTIAKLVQTAGFNPITPKKTAR